MKSVKSLYFALFAVSLLVAGNVTVRARTTQQTGDQAKGVSTTTTKSGKKNADSAVAPKKNSSTASTLAVVPVSKPTSAQQQTPPVNGAGMVWVNTDSGVYHKPGTRWYGKTKQGKYMTEADAPKAGYRAAAAAAPKKKSN